MIIEHIFQAQYDIILQNIIHRDLKPANIGLHFDDLSSHQSGEADFHMNFNFVSG